MVANFRADNVSILLGGAGGSFTGPADLAAGSGPTTVAVGDFNADSDPDLAVASGFLGNVSILLGAAGGSFTDPANLIVGTAPFSGPLSVAVRDFNGDSDPDLAVANAGSDNVSILLGAGGGSFTDPANFAAGDGPNSVAVGDFNGDSDPDLAVANQRSDNVSILLGAPGGTFTGPTDFAAGSGPTSVAVGDFNGDSDPDLAVANGFSANVSILLGAAGGSFTGPTNFIVGAGPFSQPISVAVGDFNGDSDPDLAVASVTADTVSILLGAAGGSFTAPTNITAGSAPRSVAVGDFNGDSDPDLAVANPPSVSILLGAAGGGFDAAISFAAGGGSVAAGDFNLDGLPDLAVGVSILLNTTTVVNRPPDCSRVAAGPSALLPPNHKLVKVSLRGATDPDGDTVALTITGVTQDEPVNGKGDGNTSPDARRALAENKVFLRAERNGRGNGRVYRIAFTASDSNGGTCDGTTRVAVAHDQGKPAVDSAPPSFDSFEP